jgi:hypothetical protein
MRLFHFAALSCWFAASAGAAPSSAPTFGDSGRNEIEGQDSAGSFAVDVHLGLPPKGLEGETDIAWRQGFLRQIGYKL